MSLGHFMEPEQQDSKHSSESSARMTFNFANDSAPEDDASETTESKAIIRIEAEEVKPVDYRSMSTWQLFMDREILSGCLDCSHVLTAHSLATTLFGFLAFITMIAYEIYPLWVLNDKPHGGFAFSVREAGTVAQRSCGAGVGHRIEHLVRGSISADISGMRFKFSFLPLTLQIIAFPVLSKKYGFRRLFAAGVLLMIAVMAVMPWLAVFAPESHFAGERDLPPVCQGRSLSDCTTQT
jgi:hypothetical protein